jgi:hypothetical protein
MPSPESSTVSVTPAASVKAETVTLPSAVYLTALATRIGRMRRIPDASARIRRFFRSDSA